jgi:hypothetical protein
MITLQLVDSLDVIEKNIAKALSELANNIISQNQNNILNRCKSLAKSWILSQPEMMSLSSSSPESLAGQLGIYAGSATRIIQGIASAVENSLSIKIVKFDNKLKGGIEVNFQPSNFVNLLSLSEGHIIFNGGDLHWLDWLLKRGDNIIVVNYQYNPESGLGRSGLGNMIPGGAFRIPPEYSGTNDDNFVTRALIGTQQEKQISKIFQDILK